MPTTLAKLLTLGLGAALGGLIGGASPIERPVVLAPTASEPVQRLAVPDVLDGPLAAVPPALASDPSLASLLADPVVTRALSDPAVRDAVRRIDPALLTRPAVLDALRARRVTPELLNDPVVLANLPRLMEALPVIQRAIESAPARPLPVRVADPALVDPALREATALPRVAIEAAADTAIAAAPLVLALLASDPAARPERADHRVAPEPPRGRRDGRRGSGGRRFSSR